MRASCIATVKSVIALLYYNCNPNEQGEMFLDRVEVVENRADYVASPTNAASLIHCLLQIESLVYSFRQ